MFKRLTAALVAAMMTLMLALPAMATGSLALKHSTPDGYNDNDYQKIVAFLDIEDEEGVKNGEKICSLIGVEYDPSDPTTWYGEYYNEDWDEYNSVGIRWSDTGQRRIISIDYCNEWPDFFEMVGYLDISGCEYLTYLFVYGNRLSGINASGCSNLQYLDCSDNRTITELDISGCINLYSLYCEDNQISVLDLSSCPDLVWLSCSNIEDLDLSCCPNLRHVFLDSFSELDFSNNPFLNLDYICSEGNGLIDYYQDDAYSCFLFAYPESGYTFVGWFDSEGELISSETPYGGYAETEWDDENETEIIIEPDPIAASGMTEIHARFSASEYNEYEVEKLSSFFEIEDDEGVKNGEKIWGDDYDCNDPASWWNNRVVLWSNCGNGAEVKAEMVNLPACELTGSLDLCNFDNLSTLYCSSNSLTDINISGCSALVSLHINENNLISEIDLSSSTHLIINSVRSEGNGYVGCMAYAYTWYSEDAFSNYVYAHPIDGYVFDGWYNESGDLISRDAEYGGDFDEYWDENDNYFLIPDPISASGETVFIARFVESDNPPAPTEPPVPTLAGDADGSGEVTIEDALIIMRYSLGLCELIPGADEVCNVNNDDLINLEDALLILRYAMGVISQLG